MGNSFTPPLPLPLSTAARLLGVTELLNALQRGARQATAFLDGRWGTIPPEWWYHVVDDDWRGQRVTFNVAGRIVEATKIVVDRPPLISEERKGLVEAIERQHFVEAVRAALEQQSDRYLGEPAGKKPAPKRPPPKQRAVKEWVLEQYPRGIPAGVTVKVIERDFERDTGIPVNERTVRRALGKR